MKRPSDLGSPVHDVADALEEMRLHGHVPPRNLPVVLPGSLRPHHQPGKAWVYDEANREWLAVAAPEQRRTVLQQLLGGGRSMWWRTAEARVQRALRARFN